MDMSLSKLREIAKDKEAWRAGVDGVAKSQTWLNNNKKGRLTSQEGVTVKSVLWLLLHWIPWILPVHKMSLLIFNDVWQPSGPGKTCKVDQALSLELSLNSELHVSVLPKFDLEILAPSVMVLRGGAFKRWFGLHGVMMMGLHDRINVLIRRGIESRMLSLLAKRGHREGSHLPAWKSDFTRNQICLNLGLPSLRKYEKQMSAV